VRMPAGPPGPAPAAHRRVRQQDQLVMPVPGPTGLTPDQTGRERAIPACGRHAVVPPTGLALANAVLLDGAATCESNRSA